MKRPDLQDPLVACAVRALYAHEELEAGYVEGARPLLAAAAQHARHALGVERADQIAARLSRPAPGEEER